MGEGGGLSPPDPPSLSLKAQGSRPPPHAEGRRIFILGILGRDFHVVGSNMSELETSILLELGAPRFLAAYRRD